jgi:thymidylate synthase
MLQYLTLLEKVMNEGATRDDRTGTGTKSVFGYQMRFDLSKGFPITDNQKASFKVYHSRAFVVFIG